MTYVSTRSFDSHRRAAGFDPPIGEINTTPLIDVMLVLVVMFIITIPIATHSLEIPLPNGAASLPVEAANTVSIDASDRLYWNGKPLTRQELLNQLAATTSLPEQPLLRFEPDPDASYDQSARTIALIKDSGVDRFAFIGNERYREFVRGE